MEDHPFDAYLSAQPQPQQRTLVAVAASIRTLLPGAFECISYGMPAFQVDGTSVAGLAGFKNHCSYFPHSGAVLARMSADLVGYDHNEGTLRFPVDKPLPKALLRKLVIERMRLEAERSAAGPKAREFYENGYLKFKGGVRDGRTHGAWSWYRKDGSLMRTGQFKLGAQVGTWRTFDRDANLVKETRF